LALPTGTAPSHASTPSLHDALPICRVDGTGGAADTTVHRHGGDPGDELLGKFAQGLVSREEGDGHAVVGGGVGVHHELAHVLAVESDEIVFQIHGVGQGVAGAGGPGVVAGEEHRVELVPVQAGHHGQGVAAPAPVDA